MATEEKRDYFFYFMQDRRVFVTDYDDPELAELCYGSPVCYDGSIPLGIPLKQENGMWKQKGIPVGSILRWERASVNT